MTKKYEMPKIHRIKHTLTNTEFTVSFTEMDVVPYVKSLGEKNEADTVIVFETNERLMPGTGSRHLHKKIHDAAGKGLDDECKELNKKKKFTVEEAVVTGAYDLEKYGIRNLVHVVSPRHHENADRDTSLEHIRGCCTSALNKVKETGSHKVIFSHFHMNDRTNSKNKGDHENAEIIAMMRAAKEWMERNDYSLEILFCCKYAKRVQRYEKNFYTVFKGINVDSDRDFALVLQGGGARGAFEIGALEILQERLQEKLLPCLKGFSGTSVGSINTFLFLTEKDADERRKFWIDFDQNALTHDHGQKKLGELISNMICKIESNDSWNQLLEGKYIFSTVCEKSGTRYKTQYKRWEIEKKDRIPKIILGSAAYPVMYSPVKDGDDKYRDGGTNGFIREHTFNEIEGYDENLPIQPLYDLGFRKFILIYTKPPKEKDVENEKRYSGATFYRIYPNKDLKDMKKIDEELTGWRINLGRDAANKMLDENWNKLFQSVLKISDMTEKI